MKMKILFGLYINLIVGFTFVAAFEGCTIWNSIFPKVITGEIQIVGNEPFINIALKNNNEVFILDCPEYLKDLMFQNQGKTVTVYFSNISVNSDSIKVLKVDKLEIHRK